MLNKMSEAGTAPKPAGPVSPFKSSTGPTSRGDRDDPYSRKKLSTRP